MIRDGNPFAWRRIAIQAVAALPIAVCGWNAEWIYTTFGQAASCPLTVLLIICAAGISYGRFGKGLD